MAAHLLDAEFGDGLTLHEPETIVAFEDHLSHVHRSPAHLSQGLVGGVQQLSRVHLGAEMLQPACGACANCGPGSSSGVEQVTVSAINRIFPGRCGPGGVWLASPATVAASAIAGRLQSFAELQQQGKS